MKTFNIITSSTLTKKYSILAETEQEARELVLSGQVDEDDYVNYGVEIIECEEEEA